jgi:hypothetical protein
MKVLTRRRITNIFVNINNNSFYNNCYSYSMRSVLELSNQLKRLISYFPVWYHVFSFVFAYILLSNIKFIEMIESQILINMFHFFHVPSIYLDKNLFIGDIRISLSLPVHLHILFLVFFLTLAFTTSTSYKRHTKILLSGLLCYLGFILIKFLTIVALFYLSSSSGTSLQIQFLVVSVVLTIIFGCIMIEATLFSIITFPRSTKIKPVIKRSYAIEYVYLLTILVISFLTIYFLASFPLVMLSTTVFNALTIKQFVVE